MSETHVSIIGGSFYGVRHGLETLSQLIAYNAEQQVYEVRPDLYILFNNQ